MQNFKTLLRSRLSPISFEKNNKIKNVAVSCAGQGCGENRHSHIVGGKERKQVNSPKRNLEISLKNRHQTSNLISGNLS